MALLTAALCGWASRARAGWIEDRADGVTVIHLKLFEVPDPSRPDAATRADAAAVREFVRRFPAIFAERYRERYQADPARYGRHRWERVEVQLHAFSGITVQGMSMDARPLMAIAGGVAPDVLYVNFRQSDTYIQQGFLHPLDRPEDGYLTGMTGEETAFRVHPGIWPVIDRKGPGGARHIWALPYGGALGKVVMYRKDVFDAAGVPYPSNDWTWDDLLEACRRISDPGRGVYGLLLRRSLSESYHWVTFLWSADGEVFVHDEATDSWRAAFDSAAGAEALEFYTRLCAEPWTDRDGRRRYGYACRDDEHGAVKWERGEIGMMFQNVDEKLFSTLNPEVTGMVPVPLGPGGQRGAELNSRMMGLFAGIREPAVRDAAWEYIRFYDSEDAVRIKTRVLVEAGLGRFIHPKYLERFGYSALVRFAPPGWKECFETALANSRPEPYGRNCQLIYPLMTRPLNEAEALMLADRLPADREQRLDVLQGLLRKAAATTNEKMIGRLTPEQQRVRRATAAVALLVMAVGFAALFRRVIRAFAPPAVDQKAQASRRAPAAWGFRKYAPAYLILLPALLTIFIWQYLPLLQGSGLAFFDFRILGGSRFTGLDNFGAVLWDADWWRAVGTSLRYSLLVITLTFLPPVILAILLQEVPRGKVLFRLLFYLPAVVTGLVVILLWKSFYEGTERGLLNGLMLRVPAWVWLGLGLALALIALTFARRLFEHGRAGIALLFLAAGAALAWTGFALARPMLLEPGVPFWQRLFLTRSDPLRWLQDPDLALFSCVLPLVWAGMGPGSLIYLAALKGIPEELYEAADLDGATFADKVLFVIFPRLKVVLIINFVGVFLHAWLHAAGNILAMTGGAAGTEVADLHIFYKAFMFLQFGPATAMAWMLGFLLIGFTVYQLRLLARVEFRAAGEEP